MSTRMDLDDARQFAARLAALEDADLRPEGQAIVILAQAVDQLQQFALACRKAQDGEAARLAEDADALGCIRDYAEKCNHCILYSRAAALVVPPGTEGQP